MHDRANDATEPSEPPHASHDLRGSFVAVLIMAAFFVVAWGGLLVVSLVRR